MKRTISGFTIVELLIVVVVIAILAAISMVAYTNVQNRAHNSVVESDLKNFQKAMEMARIDLGHYPRTNDEFPDFRVTRSSYYDDYNNLFFVLNIAQDRYALLARSKGGKRYVLTNTSLQPYTGTIGGTQAAAFVDLTWSGAASPTNARFQGLNINSSTGSKDWHSSWKLVQVQ